MTECKFNHESQRKKDSQNSTPVKDLELQYYMDDRTYS